MRRLLKLFDRRRWCGVYTVLTADAWFAFGVWERGGRPYRDADVAVIDDDEARIEVLRIAEERLPATIGTGMFDQLPDWLPGRVELPEPPPDPGERLDPRRFAAARDVVSSAAFAVVVATYDEGETATALFTSEQQRAAALRACDRLAEKLRTGEVGVGGERFEWPPGITGGGA